jgi:hypothetical protein
MLLRIQTVEEYSAVEALQKGLEGKHYYLEVYAFQHLISTIN